MLNRVLFVVRCISIAGPLLEESVWAEQASNQQQQQLQSHSIGPVLMTHGDRDEVTTRASMEM